VKKIKPQKSLRTVLMMWLLLFSIVPLAFITGYSLVKYEQAIDQELTQRLAGNFREIQVIFDEFQTALRRHNKEMAQDRTMTYYISMGAFSEVRQKIAKDMPAHFAHSISVFGLRLLFIGLI
jgi:two-component system, NtrC family, sensor kinase